MGKISYSLMAIIQDLNEDHGAGHGFHNNVQTNKHYEESIYSNHITLCLPDYQRTDNQPAKQPLSRKRHVGEKTDRGEGLWPERCQGRVELIVLILNQ